MRKRPYLFIGVVILLLLTALMGCSTKTQTPSETSTPTPTATIPVTQEQLNVLSAQIADIKSRIDQMASTSNESAVKQLQTQIGNLSADIALAKSNAEKANSLAAVNSTSLANLTNTVNSLKTSLTTLQQQIQSSSVVIGSQPVTIDGLSVTFLQNSVRLGSIESTTPSYAQLAVKITNNTAYTVSNLDVVGLLDFSRDLSYLATGFPSLVDGASAVNYNYYFDGDDIIHFEVYQKPPSGKIAGGPISIAKGASITLRPRVGIQTTDHTYGATTVSLKIKTIAYDKTQ